MVLDPVYLEQIELEVGEIRAVVAHSGSFPGSKLNLEYSF
jgi:hypothetical protein